MSMIKRFSLRWRLTLLYTTLLALFLLGLYIVVHLTLDRYLVDNALIFLQNRARSVNHTLKDAVAVGRTYPEMAEHLHWLTSGPEVLMVLLDNDGQVLAQPDNTRIFVSEVRAEQFQAVLAGEKGLSYLITLPETPGTRWLVYLHWIHIDETSYGVAQLSISLERSDAVLAQVRLIIFGSGGIVIFFAVVIGAPLYAMVVQPLKDVTSTAHRIADGDLSQRLPLRTGGSELAQLTDVFNNMLNRIESSMKDQRRANEQLTHLNELTHAMTSHLDLPAALNTVAQAVVRLVGTPMSAIALVEEESGHLQVPPYGQQNVPSGFAENFYMALGNGAGGRALREGRVVAVPDVNIEPTFRHPADMPIPLRAFLCAPLQRQNRILGVIYAMDDHPRTFGPAEVALLEALANQAAVAIENAQLYQDAQQKAETLATLVQEMHHRIKNNLHTVADLLELEVLQGTARTSKDSLRESVTRIKTIAAVHEHLSVEQTRLTDICKVVEQTCLVCATSLARPDRNVQVDVSGALVMLPSGRATALALVINELVTNALEHAFVDRAHGRVQVCIEQDSLTVHVTVRDDGIGLPADVDPLAVSTLGLRIVRSLVEKDLGGVLGFEQDGGTVATVHFFK